MKGSGIVCSAFSVHFLTDPVHSTCHQVGYISCMQETPHHLLCSSIYPVHNTCEPTGCISDRYSTHAVHIHMQGETPAVHITCSAQQPSHCAVSSSPITFVHSISLLVCLELELHNFDNAVSITTYRFLVLKWATVQ